MKAIILAAGYGTRLFPITINRPKSLLKINGKPLINFTIENLEKINDLDNIYIVTNKLFLNDFLAWKETLNCKKQIDIICNDTNKPDEKFTSMMNALLVIKQKNINDDCIITASDGVCSLDTPQLVKQFYETNNSYVTIYDISKNLKLKAVGSVILDAAGNITEFIEKPNEIKSSKASIAFNIFTKNDLKKIEEYVNENHSGDAPGYFLEWLYKKSVLKTFELNGTWFDIANNDQFLSANIQLSNKNLTTEPNVGWETSLALGKNYISEYAFIKNSILENCYIFENTIIKNSRLTNCVIGPDSKISSIQLSSSTLGPKTIINGEQF